MYPYRNRRQHWRKSNSTGHVFPAPLEKAETTCRPQRPWRKSAPCRYRDLCNLGFQMTTQNAPAQDLSRGAFLRPEIAPVSPVTALAGSNLQKYPHTAAKFPHDPPLRPPPEPFDLGYNSHGQIATNLFVGTAPPALQALGLIAQWPDWDSKPLAANQR